MPSKSPPPLPFSTVNAITAWIAANNRYGESLALSLGFHGFLRANELCKLRKSDISFPGDPRLSDFHNSRAGCVVRHGKTGQNQFVLLSDEVLLRRLRRFAHSLPIHSNAPFPTPPSPRPSKKPFVSFIFTRLATHSTHFVMEVQLSNS